MWFGRSALLYLLRAMAIGCLFAGLVNLFAPREYESTASVFLVAAGLQKRPSELIEGAQLLESRMLTYAKLAESTMVLEPVIKELSLEMSPAQLEQQTSIEVVPETTLLNFRARDGDPVLAQRIATSLGTQFAQGVNALESKEGATSAVEFRWVTPASVASSPSSPNRAANLAVGAGLGLAVGVLLLAWPLVRITTFARGGLRVIVVGPLADAIGSDSMRVALNGSAKEVPMRVYTVGVQDAFEQQNGTSFGTRTRNG